MTAFRPEDSEFFFGRESLIEQLRQKLAEQNFLPVLGPSGSGKSSLVLAGLIPALRAREKGLRVADLSPGSEPLRRLEAALAMLSGQPGVLVVDQFEELFTLCADEVKRRAFIDTMLSMARERRVVLTMRADFWGECAPYKDLKEAMEARQSLIAPMDADELRRAMDLQAGRVGLRFEAGLSNRILDEVRGEPGAMPLLQHALLELWKRRHGRWLRADEYEAIGGVQQAIAKTADEVYGSLSPEEQQQVRNIFVRLTRLDASAVQGERRRDTRRRVWLEDLAPAGVEPAVTGRLVQRLAGQEARLVVISVDETTQREAVEVAHEALIRHWPRLQKWLDEDRANFLLRDAIHQAAEDWERHAREESYLIHRGGRLADAEALSRRPGFLNALEANYVRACVNLRDRLHGEERERDRREKRRLQVALATFAMLFVLTACLGGWAYVQKQEAFRQTQIADEQKQEAEKQTAKAEDQARVALAGEWLTKDPTKAAAILLEVKEPDKTSFAADRMREVLRQPISIAEFSGRAKSAAFSPDGERIVIALEDGNVRVWPADGVGKPLVLQHDKGVQTAAFSPDGERIVIASSNGTARVWPADGAGEPVVLQHDGEVTSAAFSPDGERIVTTSSHGSARVWPADGKGEPLVFRHEEWVHTAAFSPDGERVVTASDDGTARVWPADGVGEPVVLYHGGTVHSAAFSPDGERIVTTSSHGSARVWPADGVGKPLVLQQNRRARSAAFSPDGKRVVTVSDDGMARVWPADGAGKPVVLRHDDGIVTAAFSPDGKRIVTASRDRTARVWPADGGKPLVVLKHDGPVHSAAFSPDGKRIVTASQDGTARIWPADGAGEPVIFRHDRAVTSAAFSPDGERIVTASEDGMARVWPADGAGKPVVLKHGPVRPPVESVAFSPDGERILAISKDHTARVWPADGAGEPVVLKHDEGIRSAAFSPDGERVVTASENGATARVWLPLRGAGLQTLIRKATTVCLDSEFREWSLGEPTQIALPNYERCEGDRGRIPSAAGSVPTAASNNEPSGQPNLVTPVSGITRVEVSEQPQHAVTEKRPDKPQRDV